MSRIVKAVSPIEQLENEKISLENETHVLAEEQNHLMNELRTIYAQIRSELRKRNDALREENGKLQAKIDIARSNLEKTLASGSAADAVKNVEKIEVALDPASSSPVETNTSNETSEQGEPRRFKLF